MLGKNVKQLTDSFDPRRVRRNPNGHGGRTVFDPVFPRPLKDDPSPDELKQYLSNELAIAEAVKRNKQIENLKRATEIPAVDQYIENHAIDPDSVNTLTWDYRNALGIHLAPFQRRILTHVLTINPRTGLFPYRLVVWSSPKKSGKTANAAFAGCWFAEYVEPPNQILVAANTQGQATGRIFNSMLPTLKFRGAEHRPSDKQIILKNGTLVQSITNNPKAEAGASYGLVLISELWGWDGDRAKTLWAETMPVPTRLNSIRWVESYVGYEDTSEMLLSLFLKVFTDTSETQLQPNAEPVPELIDIQTTDGKGNPIPTCYRVPDESMFMFIDHEHRFDWISGERGKSYYRTATVGMDETDINRLVHNRWQKTQSPFITPDMLHSAIKRGREKNLTADGTSLFTETAPRRVPSHRKLTLAIDASQGRIDTTALAGVYSEHDDKFGTDLSGRLIIPDDMAIASVRFNCGYFKAYEPTGDDFDLDEMVGADVVRLWKAGLIKRRDPDPKESKMIKDDPTLIPIAVVCDPTQMHTVRVNLRKKHKLLIKEFDQGKPRLKADTYLHRVFKNYQIDIPPDDVLSAHLDAAKSMHQNTDEIDARVRIVKPTTATRAIDGAVALSMAVYTESLNPPPRRMGFGSIAFGKAKGL